MRLGRIFSSDVGIEVGRGFVEDSREASGSVVSWVDGGKCGVVVSDSGMRDGSGVGCKDCQGSDDAC